MSEATRSDRESLPASMVQRIDEACDRFEAAWRTAQSTGQRPRLEDYLGGAPASERSVLLRELMALEFQYRLHNGESPTLEEYCLRFPEERELIGRVYRQAGPSSALSCQPERIPHGTPGTGPYNPMV